MKELRKDTQNLATQFAVKELRKDTRNLSTRFEVKELRKDIQNLPTQFVMKSAKKISILCRINFARRSAYRRILCDESGSLVILTFSLFLLLLISSLAVINISDSFLAKRQLVEIGEVAITRAAHSISLSRYYSGNILMDTSGADGPQFRIPLDCQRAQLAFQNEISSSSLRGKEVSITSWNCVDDEVEATIQTQIPTLISLPLGIGTNSSNITATVGATSIIGGTRE